LQPAVVTKVQRIVSFLQDMEREEELRTVPSWKAHMLTGDRKATSLQDSAAISRARGKNAVTSSMLGSVSTGLQGWKAVRAPQVSAPGYAEPFRGPR